MNQKQEEKRKRLEMLKSMLTEGPKKTEDLVNIMIVNFAISRRTALEEINAVKFYMEETQDEVPDLPEEDGNSTDGELQSESSPDPLVP